MNYSVYAWYPNEAHTFNVLAFIASLPPILNNPPFIVGQIWPRAK